MAQRGRISSAALSVVSGSNVHAMRRPEPPDILDDEEAKVWIETVERLPADWFGQETHMLLVQYCRTTIRANQIKVMIQKELDLGKSMDMETYWRLSRLEVSISSSIANLATKMRITQQSSYDRKKSKPYQTNQKLALLDIED